MAQNTIPGRIEDIIFENRNKAYGAYDIRQKYIRFVQWGLGIAVGIAILVILIPVISRLLSKKETVEVPDKIETVATLTEPPPTNKELPPPPEIKIPQPETIKFVPPKVVETVKKEEKVATMEEIKQTANVSTETHEGNKEVITEPVKEIIQQEEKPEEPLTFVEQSPEFNGGEAAMFEFIQKNIHYPAQAQEFNIQGKVYVQFVVEKDGKVSNVTVLRGIGGGCDEEAKRVVSMLPPWKPGKQNGRAVRVYVKLPVKFTLR